MKQQHCAPELGLEATHLRDNLFAVRPIGALGTAGWINGKPWTVKYVRADSAEAALRKAAT